MQPIGEVVNVLLKKGNKIPFSGTFITFIKKFYTFSKIWPWCDTDWTSYIEKHLDTLVQKLFLID